MGVRGRERCSCHNVIPRQSPSVTAHRASPNKEVESSPWLQISLAKCLEEEEEVLTAVEVSFNFCLLDFA
jgi:hypothetical protein